jgi:hypothetical protein
MKFLLRILTLALLVVGTSHVSGQAPRDFGGGALVDGRFPVSSGQTRLIGTRNAQVIDEPGTNEILLSKQHSHNISAFKEPRKVLIVQMTGTDNTEIGEYRVDWIEGVDPRRGSPGYLLELNGKQQGNPPKYDEFENGVFDYDGKVQALVIREFSNVVVENGGTITCPAWNGHTGGILMFMVRETLTIEPDGKITAKGKGFKDVGKGGVGGTGGAKASIQPPTSPSNPDAGQGVVPPRDPQCVKEDRGYNGPVGGWGSERGNPGNAAPGVPGLGFITDLPTPNSNGRLDRLVMGGPGDGGQGGEGGQGGGTGAYGGQSSDSRAPGNATTGNMGGDGKDAGSGGDGGPGGGVVYIKANKWNIQTSKAVISTEGGKGENAGSGGLAGFGGKGGNGDDGFQPNPNKCSYTGYGSAGAPGKRGKGGEGATGGDGGQGGTYKWIFRDLTSTYQPSNVTVDGGEEGRRGVAGGFPPMRRGFHGTNYLSDKCKNCNECFACTGPNSVPKCGKEAVKENSCATVHELFAKTDEKASLTNVSTDINGQIKKAWKNEDLYPNIPTGRTEVYVKYVITNTNDRVLEATLYHNPVNYCSSNDLNVTHYRSPLIEVKSSNTKNGCDNIYLSNSLSQSKKILGDKNDIKGLPTKVVNGSYISFGAASNTNNPEYAKYHFGSGSGEMVSYKTSDECHTCSSRAGEGANCPETNYLSGYLGVYSTTRDCPNPGNPGKDGDDGDDGSDNGGEVNEGSPNRASAPPADPEGTRYKKSTGINSQMPNIQEIKIYPNPTSSVLNVSMKVKEENTYNMKLVNGSGKVMVDKTVDVSSKNYQVTIDTDSWSSGVYHLRLLSGDKSYSHDVVVK